MLYNVEKLTKILNTCKVVKYWEYKSVVDFVFTRVEFSKVGYRDDFFVEEDNQDKLDLFRAFEKVCKKSGIFSTNKIVIQIKTKEEEIFNVGWYDGCLMLGVGRRGDKWITPIIK